MFETHSFISTQLEHREPTALLPGTRATDSHVRKVLHAAATRTRNLSVITFVGTSALALLAVGMTWSGLAMIGFGTLLYSSLIARDAVSENFLATLFSFHDDAEEDMEVLSEEPDPAAPSLGGLEANLRAAYWDLLVRRSELQERINTGPAILRASFPEANQICDTLLAQAHRLVARGQRLHTYLKSTKLTDLSDSVSMGGLLAAAATDHVAAGIYRQVVSRRELHIETHVEVEGLYDRVLAQLMLIETTLAGAIARLVRISAANDEGNSITVSLISRQLEGLVKDVECLEQSLDEVSQDDCSDL